ncbi:cellulase family glycosylhydrolase [Priestia megaterium]|uniref:cellulase family glycosylhydrolase n=1 Tax=Priestia megaterium TaxID=1404 RepID=UPI0027317DC3|nr:cellulase family glycosylhydrolase [Priestia megaterium]MDP1383050.1 cellulase family glycosylhydrolase [Priestia megaterium]MDP1426904.1 cellulase family glycosylhydrolase [Priestia megaterium]
MNSKKITIALFIMIILIGSALYFFYKNSSQKSEKKKDYHSILQSRTVPNGLGISVHFSGNPIDLDMVDDAGFKIVREDLFWHTVEKEPGKYDFKKQGYDLLTDSLIEKGIRPYYVLDYSNELYESKREIMTKKGQDAFIKYVDAASSRYKNKGIIWEIWNEPNLTDFWETQPNYKEYSKLVKRASKTIKKNDPSGIVVAPALAGITPDSLEWLEEIFKEGTLGYIDALSVHPYRGRNPETVVKDYKPVRVLINKYTDKEIPIISGEWGYSNTKGWYGKSITEQQQADYLVRMYLINLLYDVPISVIYGWKNDGIDPKNKEHNFGIRRYDVNIPKPAYNAINNMTYRLSGYTLKNRIDVGDSNDYVLKFVNKQDEEVIVYWTSANPQKISMSGNEFRGRVLSFAGQQTSFLNADNNKTLYINGSPKYILVEKDNK